MATKRRPGDAPSQSPGLGTYLNGDRVAWSTLLPLSDVPIVRSYPSLCGLSVKTAPGRTNRRQWGESCGRILERRKMLRCAMQHVWEHREGGRLTETGCQADTVTPVNASFSPGQVRSHHGAFAQFALWGTSADGHIRWTDVQNLERNEDFS